MSSIPFSRTEMMIRKPVAEVFQALVDPAITTRFWFTHSTAKLAEGVTLTWTWEMYGLTVPVTVTKLITDQTIEIKWGNGEQRSTVEWQFRSLGEEKTFVTITHAGFQSTGDALVAQVRDSTKGFTFLLAGLKAWLEHQLELNLTADAYPKELTTP